MKTLSKLGAAAVLVAVVAGASAGEAIEEIVVTGARPSWALPQVEMEQPAKPVLNVEPHTPVITLPRVEIATLERRLG